MDWKAKVELFEEIRREYESGEGTAFGVARKLSVHGSVGQRCSGPAQEAVAEATAAGAAGGSLHRCHSGSGPGSTAQAAAHGPSGLPTNSYRVTGL